MRPMLAAAVKDVDALLYPMIASPKLDGIRCLTMGGKVLSRSLKEIPNRYIRSTLEGANIDGLDGELMVGGTFQECSSGIMSRAGEPNFTYWVFDVVDEEAPYQDRLTALNTMEANNPLPWLQVVPTVVVRDSGELLAFESECLGLGFEGICLRKPDGRYKHGRSTLREGWLLKLKRFVDSEARILGFEEQMRNDNALKTNELGLAKRSHAKAGKVGKNTLGKFLVQDLATGVKFAIGTGEGLTEALREEIWFHRLRYLNRVLRYKSQPFGVKDAPRLPIFTGFRDPGDLS